MKQRCNNPKNPGYENYGGRGITYCTRWERFANFYLDMEKDWAPGLMLERVDNNGEYSPDNCGWATRAMQNRNKRPTEVMQRAKDSADEIRRLYSSGDYTQSELGRLFTLDQTTISLIVTGKRWS